MHQDYLAELGYLALISRLKRLSDITMTDGRKLYNIIDIGIEPNWFLVFKILLKKNQSSISEIASILQFAHPSVITIVKKMEKAGYLEIVKHPTDGRRQLIKLTEKARRQLPVMQKVWKASEESVGLLFSNDTFVSELSRLEEAFNHKSFDRRVLRQLSQDELKIVAYTDEDVETFASLNEEWLRMYFAIEPIDVEVFSDPRKHILEKDGCILMAKLFGKTVGTVALLPISECEVELCRMAVDPDYRGAGIGNELLVAALNAAKNSGNSHVTLYSSVKLKSAIQLYKKHGFQEISMGTDVHYERADIKMSLKIL